MNLINQPLLWAVIQVTAVTTVTVILYAAAFRSGPRCRASIALTGLLIAAGLSIWIPSPWPTWNRVSSNEQQEQRIPDIGADESPETLTPSADLQRPVPSAVNDDSEISLAAARAFLAEFVEPTTSQRFAEPTTKQRSIGWGLIVAALLVVLGICRLIAGWWCVWRLRRGARPIGDRSLDEKLSVLRAALGCRRRVEVLESDRIATAAAIGCRRPAIVLPSDWRRWSEAERQVVLAHELAHIRRSDSLTNLIAQAALAIQFYHPLAHWLLARLRLEQELAADATAASISGGRDRYLKILAGLALRNHSDGISWPARAFLPTRYTFIRRIEMLRTPHPLREWWPRLTRCIALGALILIGVVMAGFRPVPAETPQSAQANQTQPNDEEKSVSEREGSSILAYVPGSAELVAKIEVRELRLNEELTPLKEELEQANTLATIVKRSVGVPIDQINQLVVYVERFAPAQEAAPIFIVRTTDGRTVKKGLRDDEATDLKPEADDSEDPKLAERIQQLAEAEVFFSLDMAAARPLLLRQVERGQDQMLLSSIRPLIEEIDSVAAGLRVSQQAEQRIVAETADAESAEAVKETSQALITLARNALRGAAKDEQETAKQTPTRRLANVLVEVLGSAVVNVDGERVTATLEADPQQMAAAVARMVPAVSAARSAARRLQSANNMKQIGLAIHNYANYHGHLPPAVIVDDGVPRSWRVEILPFLGYTALYGEYQKDEPWDSAANRRVLEKMPDIYRHPADDRKEPYPSYFALVPSDPDGKHETAWKPRAEATGESDDRVGNTPTSGLKFLEIIDGTSSTILAVTAKRDIPWTKPQDVEVDLSKAVDADQFGGFDLGGFNSLFVDGSVTFIASTVDPELLKNLITRSGLERDPRPIQPRANPLNRPGN